MCTLVLAWQVLPGTPIAVAANRDEALGRPAEPPGVYRTDPRVIAPRDASAGGTWIGYNEAGCFVGITNRWVDRAGERSRGLLVADCLEASSATAALESVRQSTAAETYAGFNLVVADADRAAFVAYDGDLSVTDFDPGVHVVVNVGADGAYFEPSARPEVGRQQADNATAVRAALSADDAAGVGVDTGIGVDTDVDVDTDAGVDSDVGPTADRRVGLDADVAAPDAEDRPALGASDPAADWLARAAAVLGDHAFGVCVHGEGFGTRSASLIALGDDAAAADGPPAGESSAAVADRYWFADGAPCRTAFQRVESRL